MDHDVFISYSSKDKPFADAACGILEKHGLRCWIAPRDLLPGSDWGAAIIDAIEGSRVFVLVFSANANASVQVKREVERAVAKGLNIMPVRIEDVVPSKYFEYFISSAHWLDAITPPMEEHLTYLAEVIGRIVNGPTVPLSDPPTDRMRVPPDPLPRPVPQPLPPAAWMAGGAAAVAVLGVGLWLALREPHPPGPPLKGDVVTTDKPEKPQTPATAFDTRLSGTWNLTVPTPAGTQIWTMMLSDGHYDLKIVTAGNPVPYLEAGGFSATGGTYHWTPPNGGAFDGRYKVLAADAVEMTGPLGTATWQRIN